MFIVSAKFEPKKALRWAIAAGILLLAVILTLRHFQDAPSPGEEPVTAATDQERVAYLESLGWEADPAPTETLTFSLPQPLSEAYEEYNQLQLEAGFDLTPYQGMTVDRSCFTVLNYPNQEDGVLVHLLCREGELIGGDLCSVRLDGFLTGLIFPTE